MSTHEKDVSGFERVYYAKKELVFQTAMRYSDKHYHIAQEITQDVFLKLYSHFDTFDEDYLVPWLVAVTKNMALNYQKRARREVPDADIEVTVDLHIMDDSAEDYIFERIEEEERNLFGRSVLDELYKVNERWYEAVTMVYCMGRKQKDVAEELGISIEVLHSALYRARKWIRENQKPEK